MNPKQSEIFYIKLNCAFAFIFILVMVASGFGISVLYNLGQVINTTEKETFPATLAAMRLSERTALIAASAPALAAASNENEIKSIYSEFEKHMAENKSDLEAVYKMGDPQTLTAVKESLERVSLIEKSLREMVKDKFALNKQRHDILNSLLKLQADLDDTLGPLIWGTTSLTKLLGKRTVRIISQTLNSDVDSISNNENNDKNKEANENKQNTKNIDTLKNSLNQFTEISLKPLQTALDIKSESALLMSLLNMAMHVSAPDDIFPLENRASRSFNVFLQASREFDKGELSKRNPILSVNLKHIEQNFTELIKGTFNPFDVRRREIEKDVSILSLLNQGRQEAKTLSLEIETVVGQVQHNLHHQAELVSKRRLMGVTVLCLICIVSLFLSLLVAILTTRALRNRDAAIQQAVVEAERANRIKTQFLANMSHEIRTPMNSVLGFLELVLEDESLNNEQYKQLSTAHSSAQGLLSLINDILDMNKLESGKVEIEYSQFSLSRLIEQIFELMNIKASEKGIELSYSINDSLYCIFSGDALRLRQVIINLIGNAIKFTHKGSVTLNVTQDGMLDKSILLHFTIEDTGIGIASDRLRYIFEPFTQADSSTTRRYGGTGLGTTISKQIVELMGGQIWAESEEGKGSIFHFTIPLSKVEEPLMSNSVNLPFSDKMTTQRGVNYIYKRSGIEKPFKDKDHLHKRRKTYSSYKILVAEDVEANALLVKTRLKLQGHNLTLAKNGAEAVKAFENEKFDIILMDVHMPEMDGLEATSKIRLIEEKKGGHIPIIALTASIMQDEINRFIDAGMDSFVGKPIDFNELAETMDKYIPTIQDGNSHQTNEQENSEQSTISERSKNFAVSNQSTAYYILEETENFEYINFEEGLNRWQDISVYIDSLTKFADDYGNIIPTISALINGSVNQDELQPENSDKAKIEEAYRITHAIKGVASNLSLKKVAEIATEINSELYKYKKGETPLITEVQKQISILSSILSDTLNEIEYLKNKYSKESNKNNNTNPYKKSYDIIETLNINEISRLLNQLKESLEHYNSDGIDPLLNSLEHYIPHEYLNSMKKNIDDLDFGAAGNELIKLIEKLKINEGNYHV